MDIAALVSAIVAIIGVLYSILYKFAKMEVKVELLWGAYCEEARLNARRKGKMDRSSGYHLTEEGQKLIPEDLKGDIQALISKKKINPKKVHTPEIVKMLGGVGRFARYAENNDLSVGEMIAITEVYIQGLR